MKQLRKAHLLEGDGTTEADDVLLSRRELVRKVAAAGGTAFLLPAIASTIAPTPAMAGSWDGGGSRHQGHPPPPPPPPWWWWWD
ncbi:MAG: hypothetical protein ACRD4P_11310 [Bryobacteraceae bacterium]